MRRQLRGGMGLDMDRPERQCKFSGSYGNEWCGQKGDEETDCGPQQACTEAYQPRTGGDSGEVGRMQGSGNPAFDTCLSHLERAK